MGFQFYSNQKHGDIATLSLEVRDTKRFSFLPNSIFRAEVSPVEERFIQLSSEGLAWCPNLAMADTSLLLPLLVGVTFAGAIFVSNNKLQMQSAVSQPKVRTKNIYF